MAVAYTSKHAYRKLHCEVPRFSGYDTLSYGTKRLSPAYADVAL